MAKIVAFSKAEHQDSTINLWKNVFGYTTAHNDPALVIEKKLVVGDDLFFVAEDESGNIVGTVMAGYDGHRGWIYSLAVQPDERGGGIGSALMVHAEQALTALGCLKVNLQVMEPNAGVTEFYAKLGYSIEPRINMGKCLGSP